MMQNLVLVYDIESDRLRTKVANLCQDFGLDRLQFSTFTGRLSRKQQEDLMLQIGSILDDGSFHVQLFPVCDSDWHKRMEVG